MEPSTRRRPGKGAPPPKGRQVTPGTPYPTASPRREEVRPPAVENPHAPGPIRHKRVYRDDPGSSTIRYILADYSSDEEEPKTVKPANILQGVAPTAQVAPQGGANILQGVAPTAHGAPQGNPKSQLESYDARPEESVVGLTSIEDLTFWTRAAAQFIRSSAGITGSPDVWVGKRPLGEGGFGLAGLWEKIDPAGNVMDRMVIKQIGKERDGYWDANKPQEVRIMEDMKETGTPGVVELRSYRRYLRHSIHRIYMEYCPYGDLRRLARRYRRFRQYIPEAFLWEIFYYITDACAAMVNGPSGASWDHEIVHRDIKPGNIFLGLENPHGIPFYPVAKLGDWGLAVQTGIDDPGNPRKLTGAGTRAYMAPEQFGRDRYPSYLQGTSRNLASYTNTWALGAVMYELLTLHYVNSALYIDETDPYGGIEGLPEIETDKDPEYSDGLRTLIRQCLRPNPEHRPRIAEMEEIIGRHRQQMAEYLYRIRGEDKTVPAEHERLYYRGKEIEQMRPGQYRPSPGRNLQAPESGFVDPDQTAIRFPQFRTPSPPSVDSNQSQVATGDSGGYGPDGTQTYSDADAMDEEVTGPISGAEAETVTETVKAKPAALKNKFGRAAINY